MGDDQHGLALKKTGEGPLDLRLVLHIQRCGGFVQQDDGRVLQERPGDGDPLTLAAGELAAVFADDSSVSLGQLQRELIAVGQPCGRQDLVVRGVLFADADVLQDAVVEQRHVLKHDGERAEQRFGIVF